MFRAELFERLSAPALARLPRLQRRPLDLVSVALVLCVVAGAWLRTRGMFGEATIPVWDDEAAWAIRLKRDPLLSHLIRPLGFMAVSKLMVNAFGATEAALRFFPWAAGIGTLLLAPRLGWQLFGRRPAQLFFVAIIAFHPDVIDFAKEYKHYSVAIFVHAGLVSLALAYTRERDWRSLGAALAAATVSIFFAQDAVFAYSGFYLVLAWGALAARQRGQLVAIASCAAVMLAVLGALHWFVWRHLSVGGGEETTYWGKKYDVFYLPGESAETRWAWIAEKYRDIAAQLGARRDAWGPGSPIPTSFIPVLRSMDALAWVALHVVGVVVLLVRRLEKEALLLLPPLLTLATLNALGFWPFGVFRTNAFTIVYMAAIAGFAISPLEGRWQFRALAPTAVMVLLPLLVFERRWHARKEFAHTMQTEFPAAFRTLVELADKNPRARQEPLVLDSSSCGIWRYYLRLHPTYRVEAPRLRRRFDVVCTWRANSPVDLARSKILAGKRRAWFFILDQEGVDRFWASSMEGLRVAEKVAPARATLVGNLEPED